MAEWLDFLQSIEKDFQQNPLLKGIRIDTGRDVPIPQYPAIRLIRGPQDGEQRLRARHVSTTQTIQVIIEAWEGSTDPNPMVAYAKLSALEEKITAALEAWADNPPFPAKQNFYAWISSRVPGDEALTRPAVGSKIVVNIKYG